MLPTLRHGDIVVATGWYSSLRIGDIVIVRHDDMEKIKRVSKIHNGKIYVLGDNAKNSQDSRIFGWLPFKSVIGKVVR